MSVLTTLLRQYLLPRHGKLLSFALWLSVAGVALGVVQLLVVLSVMSGFIELLEGNYTRITSDIVLFPKPESTVNENIPASALAVPGVQALTPVELAQGMVLKGGSVGGVMIEGIDRETTQQVTPWESVWEVRPDLRREAANPYWIWLGTQLARKLGAKVGDVVELLVAEGQSKRVIAFEVSAIVKFGIYDHDLRWVRIGLPVFNEVFRRHHLEPIYRLKVAKPHSVDAVAIALKETLQRRVSVKKWSVAPRQCSFPYLLPANTAIGSAGSRLRTRDPVRSL